MIAARAAGGRAVHRRHRAGREPAAARTRHSHHGNLGLSARSHRHAGRPVQLRRRLHGGQPSGRARLPARGVHGPPRRPRRIAPPGLAAARSAGWRSSPNWPWTIRRPSPMAGPRWPGCCRKAASSTPCSAPTTCWPSAPCSSARPQAGRAARSGRAGLWRNRYRRRDPARADHHRRGQLDLGRRAGEMLLQRLGGGMPAHPHRDAAAHPRARQRSDPALRRDGRPPWPGICLPDRCPIFRTAGKPMHDLNDLYYFVQVVRNGGARRPGAGHTQVATEPAHRAAGGKAGRAPDPALDPQLRGHGTRPEYYEQCLSMLAGAEAAQEVIDRTHAEPQGTIRLSAAGADPLFPGRADRALHGQVPEGAGLPEELQPSGGRAARGLRPGRAGTLRTHRKQRPVMKPLGISGQRRRRARAGAPWRSPPTRARSASCRRWRWASTDAKATGSWTGRTAPA